MSKKEIQKIEEVVLKEKIYTIRGLQVMLDSDLAELYGVQTKVLNQAVKRNKERFPVEFCFLLNNKELSNLRSQIVTSSWGGLRYVPYVFTEHGVVMLSSVLRSKTASEISIETDKNFEKVFSALESNDNIPTQGIFFQGEIFKAYKFVSDIFRTAKSSIVIIDNYIDDTVLTHLAKTKDNVKVKILTKSISKQLRLDIDKFEKEFFSIEVKVFKESHDRFIIIDDEIVYHFGASLKDLGKKLFAFSRFEIDVLKIFGNIL